MMFLSALVVVGGAINLNTVRVSKYTITILKRNTNIDHLRVAFVADLHTGQNSSLKFVEQFVRKANALKPDIMLFGGDLIEGRSENETTNAIDSVLKCINYRLFFWIIDQLNLWL